MSAKGRAARDKKMRELQEATPEDACVNVWYRLSRPERAVGEGSVRNRLDDMEPIVCGKSPAKPTDAPLALKHGTTRVCDNCASIVITQEQLEAATRGSLASREWLLANGHEVLTARQIFGDDDEH